MVENARGGPAAHRDKEVINRTRLYAWGSPLFDQNSIKMDLLLSSTELWTLPLYISGMYIYGGKIAGFTLNNETLLIQNKQNKI